MREKYPSIIEAKRDSIEETQARKDWALVTGNKEVPKATYYQNINTGDKYFHLAGAIGWPLMEKEIPGYVLIIGVRKTDDGSCSMIILEEMEDSDIRRLIVKCILLREKYGYWQSSTLMRHFYGDDIRYEEIESNITRELREKDGEGEDHGFYIYPPYGLDRLNHFEIYVQQIRTSLIPRQETGKKELTLGAANDKIRNYLQTLSKDSVSRLDMKKRAKLYPGVFALGCLVHTLLKRRPWLENSGGEGFNMEF
jgi:hypothetical protein